MNKAASAALFEEQVAHLEGDLLAIRRWTVFSRLYATLDVGFDKDGRTPFRVRMECEDWSDVPPSITLRNADGVPLKVMPSGSTGIFHQGPHATTGLPFICMAGSREYHTHTSHTGDLWDGYKTRAGYDLGGILTRIWNGWLKSSS